MDNLGFFILRHVNKKETDKYWQLCYDSIRKFYPENKIIIIDDNSNYDYVTKRDLYKTKIIQSEFPGRGEILPYYYYLKNYIFESALILHDSTCIQKKLDLSVDKYKILWEFEHKWDQVEDETRMIDILNDVNLKKFHENKDLWKGCFGGMTIITYKFLKSIDNKYNLSKLLNVVKNRHNRKSFERVFACMLQINHKKEVLFCDIHKYCSFGLKLKDRHKYKNLPIFKFWSGR